MPLKFSRNEIGLFAWTGACFGAVLALLVGLDPFHYLFYSMGLSYLIAECEDRLFAWWRDAPKFRGFKFWFSVAIRKICERGR